MVGLVGTIIQLLFQPDLAFGWPFGTGIGMCTIAGIALGIRSNKEDIEKTESTYDEAMSKFAAISDPTKLASIAEDESAETILREAAAEAAHAAEDFRTTLSRFDNIMTLYRIEYK